MSRRPPTAGTEGLTIRWAGPADAQAIAGVHVRSWKAAYPGLVPQDFLDSLTPEARVGPWREILSSPPCASEATLVLVAEPSEEIVGFANYGASRDGDVDVSSVGEVRALYLDPSEWGRGSCGVLLAAAVGEVSVGGYGTATLWVLGTNARARRFYEKLGWQPDGTSKLHDWKAFVATDVRYRIDLS